MAHDAFSSSGENAMKFHDAERKMLSDLGVELPGWDTDLDFIALRVHDLAPDLRSRRDPPGARLERLADRLPLQRFAPFGDLSESERVEVLKEHADWTVSRILTGRWKKHEAPSAPAAPATP